MLSLPRDHVIDAGANIGYMTMLFSARIGANGIVHSFEPHPQVRAALERNVDRTNRRENVGRVIVHDCALGDRRESSELIETDYFAINQGTARIASTTKEDTRIRSYPVEIEALDSLFPDESFTLLKVDVEEFDG